MDNVTHTLLGALLGDAAHRFVAVNRHGLPGESRRVVGIGLMVAGSNLPDLDFLYSAVTGSKLDYLLQHRGYSHTLVASLLVAAATWWAALAWIRRRRLPWSPADLRYLAGLALLAPLTHIGLDFTNSYGVHPFWPFDNHWYYGDAVFIVEPLLWACAAPLLFTLRSNAGRLLVATPLLATPVLARFSGMIPLPQMVAMAAWVTLLALLAWRLPARAASAAGVAAWLGVTLLFFAAGHLAQARVAAGARRAFPAAITLDSVLTPLPANPVCRELLLVQLDGDAYVVRRAAHSLAPSLWPASACPLRGGERTTAPLAEVPAASDAEFHWMGQIGLPRSQLAALQSRDCAVRALLRFARVPWSAELAGGRVVGDLRYDREPGNGFAEITLGTAEAACPRLQPDWVPPREDVLMLR